MTIMTNDIWIKRQLEIAENNMKRAETKQNASADEIKNCAALTMRWKHIDSLQHQRICDIVEDVKCEICDGYCKYPEQLDQKDLDKVCENCPLTRL